MRKECPNCNEESITYANRITMHGGMGTICPKCNAELGTTRKWNVLLILLIPLSIIIFGALYLYEMNTLSYITLGLLFVLVSVIYAFMPLKVVKPRNKG